MVKSNEPLYESHSLSQNLSESTTQFQVHIAQRRFNKQLWEFPQTHCIGLLYRCYSGCIQVRKRTTDSKESKQTSTIDNRLGTVCPLKVQF